jgi:hypothetical protein
MAETQNPDRAAPRSATKFIRRPCGGFTRRLFGGLGVKIQIRKSKTINRFRLVNPEFVEIL